MNHFHLFSVIFSPCLLLYLKNFTTVLHSTNTSSTTLSWEDGLFCFIPGEVLGFNSVKSPMTKLKEAENQHPTKNKSPQRHREPAFPIKHKRIRLPRSDDTVGQQHVIECLWCVYCWKGEKSHEHRVILPLCFLWICANFAVLYPEAKQGVRRFSLFLPRQEKISKCDTEKPERLQSLYTLQLGGNLQCSNW